MARNQILANERIRSSKVVFIDIDGKNHGEISISIARHKAEQQGLDLIQVAKNDAGTPVCKIADYGKMKYDASKKNKAQKPPRIKEITYRLNTSEHDLEVKTNKVRSLLESGHQVRFAIELRGRQKAFTREAREHLEETVSQFSNLAKIDNISTSGRFVQTMLHPNDAGNHDSEKSHQSKRS